MDQRIRALDEGDLVLLLPPDDVDVLHDLKQFSNPTSAPSSSRMSRAKVSSERSPNSTWPPSSRKCRFWLTSSKPGEMSSLPSDTNSLALTLMAAFVICHLLDPASAAPTLQPARPPRR